MRPSWCITNQAAINIVPMHHKIVIYSFRLKRP